MLPIGFFPYFCSRFVVSLCGLNRESGVNPGQFPLLCWLQRLQSLVFREGGKKRPQSEDLPQVAKQGFRELELGFCL